MSKINKGRVIAIFASIGVLAFGYQNCSGQFHQMTSAASTSPNLSNSSNGQDTNSTGSGVSQISILPIDDQFKSGTIAFKFEPMSSGDTILRADCSLNEGIASDCTQKTYIVSNVADGTHILKVSLVNSQGVKKEFSKIFSIDSTPPVVNIVSAPSAVTDQTAASFTFNWVDNLSGVAKVECSWDSAAFATCTSPVNMNLPSGSHNFRIRATDKLGNVSSITTQSWVIDLSVPSVSISQKPNAVTNQTTANFSFSGNFASFECQLDNGAYSVCSSPHALSSLSSSSHIFNVRGKNSSGVYSAVASYSWLIDLVVPTLNFMQTPTSGTTSKDAQISFSVSDTGAGVESISCAIDNSAPASCANQVSYSGLSIGSHSFKLQAIDKAGNASSLTHNWTIAVMPTPTPTPTPAPTPTPVPTPTPTPTPPTTGGGGGSTNISAAVPGKACTSSSGVASFFNCGMYFNLNISSVLLQELTLLSSSAVTFYSQLVCGSLFPDIACPSKMSYYNSMGTSNWSSDYSNTLLKNFGNSFGPNGLQISNSIPVYINTNTQRSYTVDLEGGWLAAASDIYGPYTNAGSKAAAVIAAPPAGGAPMLGFSSTKGEACDGTDCYYIVVDTVKGQLVEVRGANIVSGKMSGTKTTVNRTKAISLPPTMSVWSLTQVLQLDGNETPNDIFGYYQRDHCPSADAAGLMVAPLTVSAAELNAGIIKHALRFVVPNKKAANYSYVRPATHYPYDASSNLSNWLNKSLSQPAANAGLPYGSLLRLLPTCKSGVAAKNCINLPSNMTAYDTVLITALQKYGMYLADSTSDTGNASISVTMDVDPSKFSAIASLIPSNFEVMPTPGPFNPADIYHELAASDSGFFSGSDSNGSPVIAWSSGGGAPCSRKAPASKLMSW